MCSSHVIFTKKKLNKLKLHEQAYTNTHTEAHTHTPKILFFCNIKEHEID